MGQGYGDKFLPWEAFVALGLIKSKDLLIDLYISTTTGNLEAWLLDSTLYLLPIVCNNHKFRESLLSFSARNTKVLKQSSQHHHKLFLIFI
jgi:hypothetical protein